MFRTVIVHLLTFLISPLFAGLGTGLAFYLRYPNDFSERIETKGVFFTFGPNVYETPVTYGIVLFLGIPGYLLLKKFGLAKSYLVISYAAFVGYILSILFSGLSDDWRHFVFPSLVVSTIAMSILWLGDLTRQMQSDAAKAAPLI